ncbi:AI-2E family transporter [Patescibacteria group bacterium]|nr:MAG: AI-2E family transporter [Patescibacteria group bacterium]
MQKGGETIIHISAGTIIKAVFILVVLYLLYYLRDIVLVVLMSVVIASAVEPGTRWFLERKIPRVLAVLLIYIATAVIFVAAFYFILLPLLNESASFLKNLPEYSTALSKSPTPAVGEAAGGNSGTIFEGFSKSFSLPVLIEELNITLSNLSSGFFGTVDVIFGGLVSFLLIIALSFYLAVQEDGVGKFLRVIVPIKYENYVIDLWKRSQVKIGLWMQGQLMLAVIVGVLVFLGLSLLRVKHALLLGVLASVFELIPIFGPFLAAVPAVLLAYLGSGLTIALVVAGFYLIVQQFESQLIYPGVVKKVVGVPPIISILALVIGAKLAGFLGIILSVPLATVFMELLSDLEKRKTRREPT